MQLDSPERAARIRADRARCRALIRSGSRSFFAASLLLPSRVRQPALALYAFCRLADDAVDTDRLQHPVAGREHPVAALRNRLARAYEGRPLDIAADHAFADTVATYCIPSALPEALLEGFQWDMEGRRYEDDDQLQAYAARVAGSVGAMMACIMNVRAPEAIARACDLGVAMQLTNIARDVGEDARAGRLYLPASWMRQVGIDPVAWMRSPVFSQPIAEVVTRVLQAADVLYARAAAGIDLLPADCRMGIRAASALYAEIGHQLRRDGCDSVSRRTVVPPARKAAVLARLLVRAHSAAAIDRNAALMQTRFLIDAVIRGPTRSCGVPGTARGASFDQRVEWLLNLFERLERRDREPGRAA